MKKNSPYPVGYLLITSLFYPAILGSIFYILLGDLTNISRDFDDVIYIAGSLAIIISFSIDFLYSIASKKYYTKYLFVSDLLILVLLFIAYSNLNIGIRDKTSIHGFFICFTILHVIYIIWDLFLVPKEGQNKKIIAFDFMGLFISGIGIFLFSEWYVSGVIFLFVYATIHISSCSKEIGKMIYNKEL